jgi:uncharacterized protein (DUF1800 family)
VVARKGLFLGRPAKFPAGRNFCLRRADFVCERSAGAFANENEESVMVADNTKSQSPLKRRASRRAVLGGTLAAGSVAVAYAAMGDKLNLFDSTASNPIAAADAASIKTESVRINHLLRRAGFGATREEYDRYQSMGLEATISELLSYESVNDDAALELANQITIDNSNRGAPMLWWLTRMANTKRPLQEKMTLFWHGLLTSQVSVVRDPAAMVAQNELLRAHAFDTFPSILRAITMDPAMMVYLDMSGSVRRAPNENYARELMELFALGEGNYTEEDVREAARAFTGWQVPRNRIDNNSFALLEPVFRAQQFDNGSKTFLGRSGNLRPEDVIDIITEQPASAEYITRRLFSFFVYPDPAAADIRPFVDVYTSSGRRIGDVVEAILRSDVFYTPKAYRAQVKSPIEYTAGALKALGLQSSISTIVTQGQPQPRGANLVADMGQLPFEPPNVSGWPGGASWLNSATMFARLNFLNAATGGAPPQPQPRNARTQPAPAPAVAPSNLGTAAQALAHYLPFVLDDNLPAESRRAIVDYAGGLDAPLAPDQLRGLVYLVLGSPQFQLS